MIKWQLSWPVVLIVFFVRRWIERVKLCPLSRSYVRRLSLHFLYLCYHIWYLIVKFSFTRILNIISCSGLVHCWTMKLQMENIRISRIKINPNRKQNGRCKRWYMCEWSTACWFWTTHTFRHKLFVHKKCYTIVNDMTRNACQLVGVGRGLQSNIIRWI